MGKANRRDNGKHGHSVGGKRTPIYQIWTQMMERCYRVTCPGYRRYGKRGIKVCERWQKFPNFLTDMGNRPVGTTLDRKDNDGDYCPENCRWANHKEQQSNRSDTVRITIGGETRCAKGWSEYRGLSYSMVWQRIDRGWTPEEALEFVPRKLDSVSPNAH